MAKLAIVAGILLAMATPASAQMMGKSEKPMMHQHHQMKKPMQRHHYTMKGPSMKQCKYGYKRSYMRSMHWSRASFKTACHRMMMKH